LILKGSGGYSGDLGSSGGNLVVVAPDPGIYFGTVKKPGMSEQFTYFILFKYGRPLSDGSSRGLETNNFTDGTIAETKDAIELDGRRVEAAYRLELNETRTAVAVETLKIGGRSVDIASGRVFLIDLRDESPVYRQRNIELPTIDSPLESTDDVQRLAETIRDRLKGEDAEIRAFLE
jgi:hypothetical protein